MNTEGEIQLRRMVLGLPFDLQSPTGESPARILVPAVVCRRSFTTHVYFSLVSKPVAPAFALSCLNFVTGCLGCILFLGLTSVFTTRIV